MRIPRAVDNPCLLLHYLSQIIVADSIKPLNSPHVGSVVKNYYSDLFYNENNETTNIVPRILNDRYLLKEYISIYCL